MKLSSINEDGERDKLRLASPKKLKEVSDLLDDEKSMSDEDRKKNKNRQNFKKEMKNFLKNL